MTWKSGYELYHIDTYLNYELLLQTSQSTEDNVRSTVINNQTWTACSAMIRSNNNHLFDCFNLSTDSSPQIKGEVCVDSKITT